MRTLLAALFLLTCCQPNSTPPRRDAIWDARPAFWVWNASASTLQINSDNHPLYWQIYEFPRDAKSSLSKLATIDDLTRAGNCTPVIRLPAGAQTLDDIDYLDDVLRVTKGWFGNAASRRIQIDYDCPASRLADYALLLEKLRRELEIDHLSITALASWIDAPEFQKFSKAADQIVPMFYDLEPDHPLEITRGTPRQMTDSATIHWINRWKSCRTDWRAGLPNFQRLTLFDAKGKLIGHMQQWDYATVNSSERFRRVSAPSPSCAVFEVQEDMKVFGVAMKSGSLLVWRTTDDKQLIRALTAARAANASGAVWFAHPASAPVPARSITHLESLQHGVTPMPKLVETRLESGAVTLTNIGTGDVLPNSDGTPYSLVIHATPELRFDQIAAGDFHSFTSTGGSLSNSELVREIQLNYFTLPVGSTLRSRSHLFTSP